MIASVSGQIQAVDAGSVVVNVGGIGIRIFAPRTVIDSAGGHTQRINLFTHLVVREDDLSLYGFLTEEDLKLFQVLLGVNGVGPKVALAMLSTLSPEMLQNAVLREEPAVLQRVPGIGKKTAERIMFQLRDKFDTIQADGTVPLISDVDGDVIEVLTGLGFSIVEAQSALQHIPREVETVDGRVQLALQYLDQKQSR